MPGPTSFESSSATGRAVSPATCGALPPSTAAHPASGARPIDDQIASLEECFWRIAAAIEKFDSFVAIAFAGEPLRPERQQPTQLEMRPDPDQNKMRLRELDTDAARELIDRRSKIGGTRAELRRNQVMHSLAPLASADDLAPLIEVVHRDGRIMVNGYRLFRLSPERWNEGIRTLELRSCSRVGYSRLNELSTTCVSPSARSSTR